LLCADARSNECGSDVGQKCEESFDTISQTCQLISCISGSCAYSVT
jgi:hypothetical protein